MLLMRQKMSTSEDGGCGFTLLEQEKMDEEKNIPWEELVRRNREQLMRMQRI